MRLHTSLTADDIYAALKRAKDAGHVTQDVMFDPIVAMGSRSHPRAYEVQLGAASGGGLPENYVNQYGKRQKARRTRNAHDMNLRFSATWHEWGWFMAEVYRLDSSAMWGSGPKDLAGYKNAADFHLKTKHVFASTGDKPHDNRTQDSIVFGG